MNKRDLREHGLEARAQLSAEEKSLLSSKIQSHLITAPWIKKAQVISCYLSFNDEVETHMLLQTFLNDGKKVCIPYTEKGNPDMEMMILNDFLDLKRGHYGILSLAKNDSKVVDPRSIDVCLVPGAVFDLSGNRIGYGAGYYDRYLQKLKPEAITCGLAYSLQITKKIPSDPHDISLKKIITEDGFIL